MPAINRVGLFGTLTRTNTLLAIYMLGETHASELARILEISLSQAQKTVDSLERAGVVVGVVEGKARRLRLNPRYPYLMELDSLLGRMGVDNTALQSKLSALRRRPRRAGKKL